MRMPNVFLICLIVGNGLCSRVQPVTRARTELSDEVDVGINKVTRSVDSIPSTNVSRTIPMTQVNQWRHVTATRVNNDSTTTDHLDGRHVRRSSPLDKQFPVWSARIHNSGRNADEWNTHVHRMKHLHHRLQRLDPPTVKRLQRLQRIHRRSSISSNFCNETSIAEHTAEHFRSLELAMRAYNCWNDQMDRLMTQIGKLGSTTTSLDHSDLNTNDDRKKSVENESTSDRDQFIRQSTTELLKVQCRFVRKYTACKQKFYENEFRMDRGIKTSWIKQIVDVMDEDDFTMLFY